MKKLIIAAMVLGSSAAAHADGFVCQTVDGDLNVKVYNNVQPEIGTRTAAVMVLSDPEIQAGNKTIARFTDINETLTSSGADYMAKVDLRFNDSNLAGRNIGGTKLGHLDTIELLVNFNYNDPILAGQKVAAELVLTKRNGEVITQQLSCTRYLKG